ncbi:MAG: response regulator [Candidatus Competibacter sp.]|nr:response regulator [Candidatus Competibacter sp.]
MSRDQSENGRRSILVADDDPNNIRAVGGLLKESGYQVHVADSGELALAIAGEVPLDLILLDILMPRGMDGLETCRRLKADDRTRSIPVIFLTGREDEETTVRAFAAGGADYVKKPFDAQVLLARVRTHVELGFLSRALERALAERTRELSAANAQLRQLAMEVSLIAERERKRLAGDLHDSPMQKLALAQMQIASAAKCRDGESEALLESGLELMREALRELRSLQFELSPPCLYQEGLVPALGWLASHATRRFGVPFSFAAPRPSLVLDQNLAIVLFQCARELIYNVAKHAIATTGWIELEARDNAVRLEVGDDGKGFPPAVATGQPGIGRGGYGLFGVRERLALLGGDLAIESGTAGTRVSMRVPLAPHADNSPLPLGEGLGVRAIPVGERLEVRAFPMGEGSELRAS